MVRAQVGAHLKTPGLPGFFLPMLIQQKSYHTIWTDDARPQAVKVIDQRVLPHRLVVKELHTVEDACHAIRDMIVRGAPLIGVTAAYGVYLACIHAAAHNHRQVLEKAITDLASTRPTAVNLHWALERMRVKLASCSYDELASVSLAEAAKIRQEDILMCSSIGDHGLRLIEAISRQKGGSTVNILTHCNAGWLACVDWGTATSAIYKAHQKGVKVHVWVDETRPRNQGANLTAFELLQEGVPHTLIADNTGGHLMQHGQVDMVIVGADRITSSGDAANKIGTYLKALAAKDNHVPFYVAAPYSTIDWNLIDGVKQIPIEERNGDEVRYMEGLHDNEIKKVLICPPGTPAANYGFDVTPARLITGIITERGIAAPAELRSLYQMIDEGYIKFNCNWRKTELPSSDQISDLLEARDLLFSKKLIGHDAAHNVGYGNISKRIEGPRFIISGTQTGHIEKLGKDGYSLVESFDIDANTVNCAGPSKASSESLTHASVYSLDPAIRAVVHVHHKELWKRLLHKVPTTGQDVAYGTPQMANEVRRLADADDLRKKKIFVMAGHEDGVITFGESVREATELMLRYFNAE